MPGSAQPPRPPKDPREDAADRLFDGLKNPRVTRALIMSMVGIHVAVGSIPYRRGETDLVGMASALRSNELLTRCGAMHAESIDHGELWRLVSSIFLHGDGIHITLNMIALFALGRMCEAVYGPARFLWLFLLSGIAGETLSWVGGNPMSVGASGGIFGLMGAAIIFGWKNNSDLPDETGRFFRYKLIPWVIFNLSLGLVVPVIDNLGHLGGLIGGTVLAMTLGNRVVAKTPPRSTAGLWMSLLSLGLLVTTAVCVYGQWNS